MSIYHGSSSAVTTAGKTPEITSADIALMLRIKRSVLAGHDVEVKSGSDGNLKLLEVSKKNITAG